MGGGWPNFDLLELRNGSAEAQVDCAHGDMSSLRVGRFGYERKLKTLHSYIKACSRSSSTLNKHYQPMKVKVQG